MEENKTNKSLNWKTESIKIILLEFLRKKGFVKFEKQSINVLSDLFVQFTKSILLKTKNISNYNKRDSSNFLDLINALKLMNIDLTDIKEIIEEKKQDNSITNFNKISNHIIKEYTQDEPYLTKRYFNELDLSQNYKMKNINCDFENGMISPYKDRENLLFISLPPVITTQETEQKNNLEFKETEVKNFKVEEKRTYELENCRINPETNLNEDNDLNEIKFKIPKLNVIKKNIFSQENKRIENIDINEISNNKLFN